MKTAKKTTQNKTFPNEKEPYFQEWLASKVDPEIIELNVEYLKGNYALEALLGNALEKIGEGKKTPESNQYATAPVSRLLNKYQHLVNGGWYCAGVNVTKNYEDSEWGCFKPDNPRTDSDGKPIKYEHPPSQKTKIFALKIADNNWQKICEHWETPKGDDTEFWAWVKSRANVPLFITEGAKKAGALLSAGFPAIALPGINNGIEKVEDEKGKPVEILIPQLSHFTRTGKEICFVFDQDKKFKTQKAVAHATVALGKVFQSYGCEVKVLEWNPDDGKGIDDFIANKGVNALYGIYERRCDLATYKSKKIRKVRKFNNEPDFQDFLREHEIDKRLRYNELTLELELDGEVFDEFDYFKSYFQDVYSCSVSDKDFLNAISYFAKKNSYHPVKQYLESLENVTPISLDNLSSRYFGTKSQLDNEKVKRWLIGSVARVLSPEAVDFSSALILYGREQGMGKSRFFQTLGGDWHTDDIDELRGRDNALKQHRYWILEVAEFDQITNKKEAAALKSWISTKTDTFREPFGRKVKPYRRKFAIAATVNEVELIKDETGSRRFWIIDTNDRPIDFERLKEERDGIWAAAVQAYKAGEKYWFDRHELRKLQDANAKFEAFDDWQGIIEGYLENKEICNTADILKACFNLEMSAPDYLRQQRRVSKILTKIRYTKFKQLSTLDANGGTIRPMFWISPNLKAAIESGEISEDATLLEYQAFNTPAIFEVEQPNIADKYSRAANPTPEQVSEVEEKNVEQILHVPSRGYTPDTEPVLEVAAIVHPKNDEKKIISKNTSEIPPPKTERQCILDHIKEQQERLEWDDENLKINLKRTFPQAKGTKDLTD